MVYRLPEDGGVPPVREGVSKYCIVVYTRCAYVHIIDEQFVQKLDVCSLFNDALSNLYHTAPDNWLRTQQVTGKNLKKSGRGQL